MKQFVALARVSSREQEREGFSLDVQEDALRTYAQRHDGSIVNLYRIAETATRRDERKTFKELIAYAREHATEIDGLLFYKVDRAARNLYDYIELEKLESEYGIPFISTSQPTDNSPAGRMMRRQLAMFASYTTEQQGLDVREGHARRVQNGLFCGVAPYGYRNIRIDGRGLIEVDAVQAKKVQRLFQMYAYENHTIDSMRTKLEAEGVTYLDTMPRWARSKVHSILRDRAYIGDVRYQGQWYAGKHKPLVDRATFGRVQVLLGEKRYQNHDLTYAGSLITCGHCGAVITGETITKKKTGREYVYYRCSRYTEEGHPRIRLTEQQLDVQVLALFDRIRLPDDLRHWFQQSLLAWSKQQRNETEETAKDLQRQIAQVKQARDRLLNLRIMEEITTDTYAAKDTELRDRQSGLELQVQAQGRGRDEHGNLAIKVFELSQSLKDKWLTAESQEKRQLLEIVCLNLTLKEANLDFSMRKPFDVLIGGLIPPDNRGDRI